MKSDIVRRFTAQLKPVALVLCVWGVCVCVGVAPRGGDESQCRRDQDVMSSKGDETGVGGEKKKAG